MKEKVVYIKDIPKCPCCKKPSKREMTIVTTTAVYYQPKYDKDGNNTNPDRNQITEHWHCVDCGCNYDIMGNKIDGFYYFL
jgi:hypothetical protein